MTPVMGTGNRSLIDIILHAGGGMGVLVCASQISSLDFCLDGSPGDILLYHLDDSSLFFGLYEPRSIIKRFYIGWIIYSALVR